MEITSIGIRTPYTFKKEIIEAIDDEISLVEQEFKQSVPKRRKNQLKEQISEQLACYVKNLTKKKIVWSIGSQYLFIDVILSKKLIAQREQEKEKKHQQHTNYILDRRRCSYKKEGKYWVVGVTGEYNHRFKELVDDVMVQIIQGARTASYYATASIFEKEGKIHGE